MTKPRPPIVTILGHVDHGKTSLLDYIRKSRIAAREHGGITQRIGAYEIDTGLTDYPTSKITFIDTPGHEAFSQLRSRGATVADVAVLVIDAKDSLMPQTVESIYHIKNAGIPFIIALNKMDVPGANPQKVATDLLKHEVIVEEKGGKTIALPISAKTGDGIEELLESIVLVSTDAELTYDPEADAEAYVIETKKDKRGVVVSVVIKNGRMKIGDTVYAGQEKAKIKNMLNDLGTPQKQVEPSTPFELLGFSSIPEVGADITVEPREGEAKEEQTQAHKTFASGSHPLLEPQQKESKKLSLIIKAESQGSLDAIVQSLAKNGNIEIILSAVGDVSRSDVFLAKSAKAIIVGFSVPTPQDARELAKQEKVIIKTYSIIYELIEELEEVSELMKEKEEQEKHVKGEAKLLATFLIEGEQIFGVKVTKGKVNISDTVELYRGENMVGKTKLVSLRHRAKPIQEVKKEMEAGMIFGPPLDMKIGDVVKFIL
jgi:translation initiation factor IF-2